MLQSLIISTLLTTSSILPALASPSSPSSPSSEISSVSRRASSNTIPYIPWPNVQAHAYDTLVWDGGSESQFDSLLIVTNVPRTGSLSLIGAEWLRLAYHDMSTHDIHTGLGGLDASIRFELDRSQNVGAGMTNSLHDLSPLVKEGVSLSDVIAAGTVLAVVGNKGPLIPYRTGRIDATEAGPATVPEPQQNLSTHTALFASQGFSKTEMIQLVACGHTLGGVRGADFPELVTPPKGSGSGAKAQATKGLIHAGQSKNGLKIKRAVETANATKKSGSTKSTPTPQPQDGGEDGFVSFDGTDNFDDKIVTGYLSSTTQNPLVVSQNLTMISDHRIFSSDGNATIKAMQGPAFTSTCSSLLERMINTVPSSVSLSQDPVKPAEYKLMWVFTSPVGKDSNSGNGNGAPAGGEVGDLSLQAQIRVTFPKPNQTVSLYWTSSNSSNPCTRATCQFLATHGFPAKGAMFDTLNTVPNVYFFQAIVKKETGIGKFWFEVNDGMPDVLPVSSNSSSSTASASASATGVSASASASDSASGSVSASVTSASASASGSASASASASAKPTSHKPSSSSSKHTSSTSSKKPSSSSSKHSSSSAKHPSSSSASTKPTPTPSASSSHGKSKRKADPIVFDNGGNGFQFGEDRTRVMLDQLRSSSSSSDGSLANVKKKVVVAARTSPSAPQSVSISTFAFGAATGYKPISQTYTLAVDLSLTMQANIDGWNFYSREFDVGQDALNTFKVNAKWSDLEVNGDETEFGVIG